jgi:site-specific recombinase XerD
VIQRRGRRWRVVVQGRPDPVTGKRRQLSGSAVSEREAVTLERQLRLRIAKGFHDQATLAAVVKEWWLSGPRLAASSRANYRSNLDNHILPVLGGRKVAEIRPRLVASFLAHLASDKALSAATVRKVRTVLSAVMSYAVAMEYTESNPVMKVPPPVLEPVERLAPTIEQTARILLAAEGEDPAFLT